MKDGYLDDVFDVLDAHCHPCILIGRYALLWMGAAVIQDSYLDLLIRNSKVAAIVTDLQRTGNWVEIPLVRTYGEDYLQPPPRVITRTDGTFTVKIWSEEAVRLLVDSPAEGGVHYRPLLIETPCCEALNPVLLESAMHPGPEISAHKPSLLTTPNIRFLPHIRCQSASRRPQSKVYIPTISRYLDALLAQQQWLKENESHAWRRSGPGADVNYLIRYLFLEMPSQRTKVLPLLKSELKSQMEEILDQYKRTHKNRFTFRLAEEGSGCDGKVIVLDKMVSVQDSPLKEVHSLPRHSQLGTESSRCDSA